MVQVTSVCLKYGFSQLKSDECVFVKIVPNTKSGKSASTFSAVLDTLCSYVDDILAFTNCQSLADDFLAHCNKRFTMRKFCSECRAESAPAGQPLPAAGGDRAWAARTGSGPMRMCGDIFAASRGGGAVC